MLLYIVAYSARSIHAYTIGTTLFDLATFEQSFWNATHGTLFFSSLEGDISHFGRHFSPIFYLLLPIYALHRDPTTLLVLQSVALGLAAIPLYLFARRRLGQSPAALGLAALYLASPAVHDINIVNEFHELAFAVPLLFLAFYAAEARRWRLYGLAVVGALMGKEDVALTVAALGIYLALVQRERRIGLITAAGSVAWFLIVVEWIMPALRGPLGPVPFLGYDYLGEGIFGIARGVVTNPRELWQVMSSQPKQDYLHWLFLPVAFVALLAPEVLLITAPGLLLILASAYPPTFAIFERYVAPILPFVYIATVIGIARLRDAGRAIAWLRERTGHRDDTQRPALLPRAVMTLALVALVASSAVYAQVHLRKYPDRLRYTDEPSPHAATAMAIAADIPEHATVAIEDHRLLVRAAHRRHLYYLSGSSPATDYLVVDRAVGPITNASPEERATALDRVIEGGEYLLIRCEDGIALYGSRAAYQRDAAWFAGLTPSSGMACEP